MEQLFSPCNRLYDLQESQGCLEVFRCRLELLQELINLDVATEDFLSAERVLTAYIRGLVRHAGKRNDGSVFDSPCSCRLQRQWRID